MRQRGFLLESRDYAVAFIAALLLNAGLFTLMPGLIDTDPGRPRLEDLHDGIQVVRVKRPETPVRKKEKAKPPETEKKPEPKLAKPVAAPKPVMKKIYLPFQLNSKLPAGPGTLSVPAADVVAVPISGGRDTYGMNEIDTPLTPVVKIPPIYPMRAKRMGTEGAVKVRFAVTKEGLVEKVEVISAEPPDIFNSAVIRCISRWRFKPPTVEGIPVKTLAETTIRFQLKN